MIEIKNLSAFIEEKQIFHNLSHVFEKGSITTILGQNGSGKSSLALTLMGHPRYTLEGKILLQWEDITETSPSERHNMGMFLSFQNIPEIPGIKVIEYLRTVYNSHFTRHNSDTPAPTPFVFRRLVEKLLPELHIDEKLIDRDLFVGFSGGEKRKIELLQISLLNPEIIILDEIDSGLDIDALGILQEQIKKWKEQNKTVIIISHNIHLLENAYIDNVIIMKNGNIVQKGDVKILENIKETGFSNL